MTGEPLQPVLTNTAAVQRSGQINAEHVRIIRRSSTNCPTSSITAPAKPPKLTWPSWPAGCDQKNSVRPLTDWRPISTRTANCRITIGPGAGTSPSVSRTATG